MASANEPRLVSIRLHQKPISPDEARSRIIMHPPNWCPAGMRCTNEGCRKESLSCESMYMIELRFDVPGIFASLVRVGFACSLRCAALFMLGWWDPPQGVPAEKEKAS